MRGDHFFNDGTMSTAPGAVLTIKNILYVEIQVINGKNVLFVVMPSPLCVAECLRIIRMPLPALPLAGFITNGQGIFFPNDVFQI